MAEEAVLDAVAEAVAGPPAELSEWDKMTSAERKESVKNLDTEPNPKAPEADDELPAPSIDTTTEQPAGGDETPAAGDAAPAEKAKDEEVEADWRDAETKDLAATYGVDDDVLAALPSREVLDIVLRAIDKKAYEAGKTATESDKPIEKPPVQQSEKQPPVEGDLFADLSQFKLLGDQFDEDAAKPINRFVDMAATAFRDLQNRVTQFEQRDQQRAADDLRRQAVASLHSLGNVELFGKPGEKPTKDQVANIEKAIDAHFIHARGLLATGRQPAPTPAFLKAAVFLAFGDQLTQQQQRQIADKLRKQASKVTGGPGAKHVPKEPPEDETDEQRRQRIASDPEVAAAARRFFTEGK